MYTVYTITLYTGTYFLLRFPSSVYLSIPVQAYVCSDFGVRGGEEVRPTGYSGRLLGRRLGGEGEIQKFRTLKFWASAAQNLIKKSENAMTFC